MRAPTVVSLDVRFLFFFYLEIDWRLWIYLKIPVL